MKKRGIGVGSMFYGIGYGFNRPDIGAAHVEVAEDGTATLFTGVCDLGQGIQTLLAQIVGTELGMPMSAIRVVDADTASTPDSGPTSGSRATFVQGQAVRNASLDVKARLFEMAGTNDGRRARRSRSRRRDRSGSRSPPERHVSVVAVVDEMHKQGKRCIGWGWQDITTKDVDPTTSQGDAYQTFGWATQLAEVEVDTDTGFVQVTRLVSATDAGRAINPMGVEGQVQGGAVMGLGYALYEQHVVDQGRARDRVAGVLPRSHAAGRARDRVSHRRGARSQRTLRCEGRVGAGHDPDHSGDPERDLRRSRGPRPEYTGDAGADLRSAS